MGSAVIAAGVDDLVVLVGRAVDGSFCVKRWERLVVPFLVADRVRYRVRVATRAGGGGPPSSRSVSRDPSDMATEMGTDVCLTGSECCRLDEES